MILKKEFLDIKRILVFNPSFIGDAILTTPLVNALKKLYPSGVVDLCIRPESFPVLDSKDSLVIYDKRGEQKGLTAGIKFLNTLKNKNYDLIISPHKSLRSTILLRAVNTKMIGFKESSLSFLYDHTVNREMKHHEVLRNLSLLAPIVTEFSYETASSLGGPLTTYLDSNFYSELYEMFNTKYANKKIVGINPGSVWATKRWSTNKFAELAVLLSEESVPVIIGGPQDKDITDALKVILDQHDITYLDYCNKIDFSKIPALIKNFDLLITNDSSPMHIAVSQGVKCIAIFGATTPSLGFSPYDEQSIIIENKELECRPCGLHGAKKCPKRHFKCMNSIEVDTVYEVVKKAFNNKELINKGSKQ